MPVGLGKLTLVGLIISIIATAGLIAGFLILHHPTPPVTTTNITSSVTNTTSIVTGIYWPSYLVFPRFAPTNMLYVVNLTGTNYYTNYSVYTLVTLQGLVNRRVPRLYIIFEPIDQEWLNLVVKYLHVKVKYVSMDEAIRMFSGYAKGYIVYDPSVPATLNVANTLSGIYDCVVVAPNYVNCVKSLGITKECMSLVGMFKSNLEAYERAFENLWNKTNHRILVIANPQIDYQYPPPNPPQIAFRDYATALKLLVVYLDAQNSTQSTLLTKILKAMPKETDVTGWYEDEEWPYMDLVSKYGKFVTVLTHHYGPLTFPNPTVWSGLYPPVKFVQLSLPPIRLSRLAHGGIYVTFYVTDGDNLQWDYSLLTLWSSPCRPNAPVAFTISPYLVNIAPFIAWYYNMTMSANNTFISGPSGAGYVYPIYMSKSGLIAYLNLTLRYFNMSNLWFTEMLGYSNNIAPYYSKVLGYHILAIKRDYNEDPWLFKQYGQSFYYLQGVPIPIIFGAFHYKHSEANMLKFNLENLYQTYVSKGRKPIFVLVISQPWDFDNMCTLEGIVNELSRNSTYNFVNFFEFVSLTNIPFGVCLIKQAINYTVSKGWLTITHYPDLESKIPGIELAYSRGNYYTAVDELVSLWRELYSDIGYRNLTIGPSIYGPCLIGWVKYTG